MPRPRKPAATLALAGAFAKNKSRTRTDIAGAGSIGPWRIGSTDPAEVWAELVAIAPPRLLTAADRPALELAATFIAHARRDPAKMTAGKLTAIANLLGKFGMTPAGRAQIEAPPPPPPQNRFLRFAAK